MSKRPTKRERLADKIIERCEVEFGVKLRNVRLIPAQGAWRTNKYLDVMAWEGVAEWHNEKFSGPLSCSIESWYTMTDLLRNGFEISRNSGTSFELYVASGVKK